MVISWQRPETAGAPRAPTKAPTRKGHPPPPRMALGSGLSLFLFEKSDFWRKVSKFEYSQYDLEDFFKNHNWI